MSYARKNASHLIRRGTVYYFRQAIPIDLRTRFGKEEIRITLRTGYLTEAVPKSRALLGCASIFFEMVRKDEKMTTLNKDQLDQMLKSHFHSQLEKFEKAMLNHTPSSLVDIFDSQIGLEQIKSSIQLSLMLKNYNSAKDIVTDFIRTNGLNISENSLEYKQIANGILRSHKDLVEVLHHRLEGDYDFEIPILERYKVKEPVVPISQPSPLPQPGITLFELIDRYCEFKIKTGKWTGRGIEEQPRRFSHLKLILGDIPVRSINGESSMHVLDCLQKLPPRLTSKQYAGKSLTEILKMKPTATLSIKTINMAIEAASGLFKFAVRNDFAEKNYFEGMQLRDPEKAEDKRKAFTIEDLAAIFAPYAYIEFSKNDPARYWLPILALYTGARQEELAQLYLSDIEELDGVLTLNINADEADKRIKTPAAKRKVPVHTYVRTTLGFENYVSEMKSAGEERLFPSLKRIGKRYGHKPSQDFNRYLRKIGLEGGKTFHSFRHTFIHFLQNKGIPDNYIASVTGHKQLGKSPIPANYNKQHWVHFLVKEVMDHVDFVVKIPQQYEATATNQPIAH